MGEKTLNWPVSRLVMVRPAAFGYNPENADNTFAQGLSGNFQAMALQEFERLLFQLQQMGLKVLVLEDSSQSPDAVFPNNWCSLHPDGRLIFYPMKALSRRREVQPGLVELLKEEGFAVGRVLDWTGWAEEGLFLEGTGSLVLDPVHHKAYATLSERTAFEAVERFAQAMGYEAVCFHSLLPSADGMATPAYHTNVLMTVGQGFVLWCPEALPLQADRERLAAHFAADGLQAIALSLAQVQAFAGNMLQVTTAVGPCLLMSHTAYSSLLPEQLKQLKALTPIQAFAIPTIEQIGGGSLRCMLLENPLPQA